MMDKQVVGLFVLCAFLNEELFGRALGLSSWSVLLTCSLSNKPNVGIKNNNLELGFLTNMWIMQNNVCKQDK